VLLRNTPPVLLAGLLYAGSGAGLSIAYRTRRASAGEAPLRRRDLPWVVLVVLVGGIAGPVLLMFGLTGTSASSASLLSFSRSR
jgi:drug/metabolite transporter (DMT)-like permease